MRTDIMKLKQFIKKLESYKRYEDKDIEIEAPNGILMEPCIRIQCKDPLDKRVESVDKVIISWE